ncbi:MAG: 50S ribosomal protein L24 [Deltaproteobacteria bacterium]|jgi:large subunit ribosomal protein L24|nr:50S ribosomal protein L24 [Deltaproteobacteria bacterium]
MARSIFRKNPYKNPDGHRICRFRKGDKVEVLNGRSRKKVGEILEIRTKQGQLMVQGVNLITPARFKPKEKDNTPEKKIEAPIAVSNVALICPLCMKMTKVLYQFSEPDQYYGRPKKIRVCKACKKPLDNK